jgi:hypothetical protein
MVNYKLLLFFLREFLSLGGGSGVVKILELKIIRDVEFDWWTPTGFPAVRYK